MHSRSMIHKSDGEKSENLGGLLRLKGAAAWLGVSVRTLYRIIAEGGLHLVHIRGCSCLKLCDLIAYAEKSK